MRSRVSLAAASVVLLVTSLAASPVVGAPDQPRPVGAADGQRAAASDDLVLEPDVVRVAGATRVETAVEVSRATFPSGVETIYVATAAAFPDALTGGPAAARDGAPVLLATASSLPAATRSEIERLAPDRIVVLGGDSAVGPSVQAELQALVDEPVIRIAGATRYDTAADVAATFDNADTVYLATGANFPDALTGGAAAARDGAPILLVTTDSVPDAAARELQRLAPRTVVALGGAAVIPDVVVEQARAAAGEQAARVRLAGTERYATAGEIAETFLVGLPEVFVATGRDFPDAMTGTPAAAAAGAPLLLVTDDDIPDATVEALRRARPRRITVLGGPAAVSTDVEARLADFLAAPAVHHIGVRDGSARPELFDRRDGQTFRPRGTNHLAKVVDVDGFATDLFRPDTADFEATAAELDRMAELGYDTVRVFLDLCRTDCISTSEGGVRQVYLDNVAAFLRLAADRDLVVMLASNDIPDPGYSERLPCCEPFGGYRNSLWLTSAGHDVAVEYWTDVVSGLLAADAPLEVVFAYEVQQEQFVFTDVAPLTMTEGTVITADGRSYDMASDAERRAMVENNTRLLTNRLRHEIRRFDPHALVTVGFFPEHLDEDPRLVPSDGLLADTELDLLDLHAYPGNNRTFQEQADALGLDPGTLEVPIVLGEYGPFKFAYADPEPGAWAMRHWMAESCDLGFSGWMNWLWQGDDDEVFGSRDVDDTIAIALSPDAHPDPCDASGTPVNLARAGTAIASQALSDQPPADAIDGRVRTWWAAGADAPQWLEVDLGDEHQVIRVDLHVSQFPAGATHHRLRVAGADHVFTTVADFTGDTAHFDALSWDPGSPTTVRYVRVETLASVSHVSWAEVVVHGS